MSFLSNDIDSTFVRRLFRHPVFKQMLSVLNSAPVWGGITGALTAQTDLQTALNAKVSKTNLPVNVKDYGAVGDGVADDTTAITNAIATLKDVYLPVGTYKTTGSITLNTGQTLSGSGFNSIIRYYGTTRALIIGANSCIKSLQVQGNGKTSGNSFETGIMCYNCVGWTIDNCLITGFGGDPVTNGGGGVFVYSLGASNTDGGRLQNCYITNCKTGINFAERGEYVVASTTIVSNSTYGVRASAGNLSLTSFNIQLCGTGLKLETGVNDGHSAFNGILCNHNTTNLDSNGITNGNSFTNCKFYSGNIIFTSNRGLRFVNCDFVADGNGTKTITLTTNTSIQFMSCRYPKNPTANYMAVSLVSGSAITEVNNLDF